MDRVVWRGMHSCRSGRQEAHGRNGARKTGEAITGADAADGRADGALSVPGADGRGAGCGRDRRYWSAADRIAVGGGGEGPALRLRDLLPADIAIAIPSTAEGRRTLRADTAGARQPPDRKSTRP